MATDILTAEPKFRRPAPVRAPEPSPAHRALQELIQGYSIASVEAKVHAGARAAWGGHAWDLPLVAATGTIPLGFSELWKEGSREAELVAENDLQIPAEYCSMIKAWLGRLHLKPDSPIRRLFYFGSLCEPGNNALELATRDGYELFCIETVTAFRPEDKRPEVVDFLADELRLLAKWLLGVPLDPELLRAEIVLQNRLLGKLELLLELRRAAPFLVRSIPTLQLISGTHHRYGDVQRFEAVLDLFIAELTQAGKTPETRRVIPLVLAGGGSPGILQVIEESDAAILGWGAATTTRYDETIDPFDAVAHYVLDAQSRGELGEGAGASATFRRFHLEKLVRETGAHGLVTATVTGCPYGSIVQQTEREHFKRLGIPIIALESSVHKERPTEEQVTRLQAFLEMLS
jgi:benzoyl-CoA reductase/2-hydroxyglutaryl-CoA dehydratase subunit BcrC/BadD/HgdB